MTWLRRLGGVPSWLFLWMLFTSCFHSPTEPFDPFEPEDISDGWRVSTPEGQGVAIQPLERAYQSAKALNNIYSLLVVKNGFLIAEGYFNGANESQPNGTASVTKSVTSALAGIALREGFLTSVEQKMMEFFPEFDFGSMDPRKSDITVRHILQMRSGYPWEEMDGYLDEYLSVASSLPLIEEFPLLHDPGSQFGYSNMTANTMGIILARASGTSLRSFADTHLFGPLGITMGGWVTDSLGYYYASGTLQLRPRDMARFGQLYLDGGAYHGSQIIPPAWVEESLQTYSTQTYETDIMTSIRQLGYGFYWWSGVSGGHRFNFAWGHGGQMIAVVPGLNMVLVASAQPQTGFGSTAWQAERAVLEIVGRLIASL